MCGFDQPTLKWFNSYFEGRRQFTSINGYKSDEREIICGVPQGSLLSQGGIRDGFPTNNNEFKQLSVFYGHTKAFYRCSGVFDARCSMPPTSWEEMKMDLKSDRKSRIYHLLFDLTTLFYTL